MLKDMKMHEFLDELASSSPTPGGGSASALLCSVGASLICMVCELTIGKKGYEESESELKKILEEAGALRKRAEELIDEDAAVFNEVMNAYKTPKDNPRRVEVIQNALKKATMTPMEIAKIGIRSLELSKIVAFKGNVNSVSDVGVAALAANAGVQGALLDIYVNLKPMKEDPDKGEMLDRTKEFGERAKSLFEDVNGVVSFRLTN